MATFIEKIDFCWNEMEISQDDESHIQPKDKVALYRQEMARGEISDITWNREIRNVNNLITLKRDISRDMMCYNEEIRDAMDDVCDMVSKWYEFLLWDYNLASYNRIETIRDLLRSNDPSVRVGVERAIKFLGGVTFSELSSIVVFKLNQNKRAYKAMESTRDEALRRHNMACHSMTVNCAKGTRKCIQVIYNN